MTAKNSTDATLMKPLINISHHDHDGLT